MMSYTGPLERLQPAVKKARSALDYYKHQAVAHCENGASKTQVSRARTQSDLNLIALLASIELEIEALRRKVGSDVR